MDEITISPANSGMGSQTQEITKGICERCGVSIKIRTPGQKYGPICARKMAAQTAVANDIATPKGTYPSDEINKGIPELGISAARADELTIINNELHINHRTLWGFIVGLETRPDLTERERLVLLACEVYVPRLTNRKLRAITRR